MVQEQFGPNLSSQSPGIVRLAAKGHSSAVLVGGSDRPLVSIDKGWRLWLSDGLGALGLIVSVDGVGWGGQRPIPAPSLAWPLSQAVHSPGP